MATLHFAERTIELRVAYVGPIEAGCGSNVRHLHRSQPARDKAELRRVGGKDRKERMWHFSYQPLDAPKIPGFELRVKVCSVPAGAEVDLDRDEMLTGVDGMVFVADARADRGATNVAALLDTERLLARQGLELGSIPMVFQVNQTDAPNARPRDRVVEELNPLGLPVHDAMARQGKGVLETHETLLAAVLTRLRDQLAGQHLDVTMTALTRATRDRVEDRLVAHALTLPQQGRQMPERLGLPATAEIPVRLPALRDSQPLHHVRTQVRDDRLRVTAVYRRKDGEVRKLAFLIEAGEDPPPPPPPRTASPPVAPPPVRMTVEELEGDLPRLAYGISGLLGGAIAGLLLGYIWFY